MIFCNRKIGGPDPTRPDHFRRTRYPTRPVVFGPGPDPLLIGSGRVGSGPRVGYPLGTLVGTEEGIHIAGGVADGDLTLFIAQQLKDKYRQRAKGGLRGVKRKAGFVRCLVLVLKINT